MDLLVVGLMKLLYFKIKNKKLIMIQLNNINMFSFIILQG